MQGIEFVQGEVSVAVHREHDDLLSPLFPGGVSAAHREHVTTWWCEVFGGPAGISGAVLLLPFQVSVLGTPSPSVTPTNLLYNVVSMPGALYRYWRLGQTGGRLALVLIGRTVPGVIA